MTKTEEEKFKKLLKKFHKKIAKFSNKTTFAKEGSEETSQDFGSLFAWEDATNMLENMLSGFGTEAEEEPKKMHNVVLVQNNRLIGEVDREVIETHSVRKIDLLLDGVLRQISRKGTKCVVCLGVNDLRPPDLRAYAQPARPCE